MSAFIRNAISCVNPISYCPLHRTLFRLPTNDWLCSDFQTPSEIELFIARQHTDARYWYSKSVCPSVCLSVCPLCSGIVSKRLNISSQYFFTTRQPNHSSFMTIKQLYVKFRRRHSLRDRKYRWSIKISRFSTNIWLCFSNDTRQRHSCHGTLIGTRMRSIKVCHFRQLWVTLN